MAEKHEEEIKEKEIKKNRNYKLIPKRLIKKEDDKIVYFYIIKTIIGIKTSLRYNEKNNGNK